MTMGTLRMATVKGLQGKARTCGHVPTVSYTPPPTILFQRRKDMTETDNENTEKKITITVKENLSIECTGFADGAYFEVIGVMRLVEAQLIQSLLGDAIVDASIRES